MIESENNQIAITSCMRKNIYNSMDHLVFFSLLSLFYVPLLQNIYGRQNSEANSSYRKGTWTRTLLQIIANSV